MRFTLHLFTVLFSLSVLLAPFNLYGDEPDLCYGPLTVDGTIDVFYLEQGTLGGVTEKVLFNICHPKNAEALCPKLFFQRQIYSYPFGQKGDTCTYTYECCLDVQKLAKDWLPSLD